MVLSPSITRWESRFVARSCAARLFFAKRACSQLPVRCMKAAKRAAQAQKQAEMEDRVARQQARPARGGRKVAKKSENKKRALLGMWGRLPLPFLALLCEYLDGRDCQRCAHIFQWPVALTTSRSYKERLKAVSHAGRDNSFCSERPRRHRMFHTACRRCTRVGPVRKCWSCKSEICSACEPFVYENRLQPFLCAACCDDRYYG